MDVPPDVYRSIGKKSVQQWDNSKRLSLETWIRTSNLVGGWALPLWKRMEFVSWDDSQYMEIWWESHNPVMFQSTNQNQSSDINDINQIIFHTWIFPKIRMIPHWLHHSIWPTASTSVFSGKLGGLGRRSDTLVSGISHSSSLILSYFSWFNSHLCYHQPCHPMIVIYSLVVGYCSCIPLFSSCFPHNSQ